VIDENSKLVDLWDAFGGAGVYKGPEAVLRCLEKNGNLIGEPSATIFRRRYAGRGFDPRYRQTVDLEMWFHLLEQGDFAYTRAPLCSFRRHPNQQTVIHRASATGQADGVLLAEEYLGKAWVKERWTRKVLFTQIYSLRKKRKRGLETGDLEARLMGPLGRGWYAVRWTGHKLIAPFGKLKKAFRKQMLRRQIQRQMKAPFWRRETKV
jgi:hypothetical protein